MSLVDKLKSGAKKALYLAPLLLPFVGSGQDIESPKTTAEHYGFKSIEDIQSKLNDTTVYIPATGEFVYLDLKKSLNSNGSKGAKGFYGDQVLNPSVQPNVLNAGNFTLNYYGSGDVDGNDSLTWNDHALISMGIQVPEADINGNGIYSDTTDKRMLRELLEDKRRYLPAHQELLPLLSQRIDWINQMQYVVDSTNTIPWTPNFDCNNFSYQQFLNFTGLEYVSQSGINFNKYDTTNNALFNIPIYQVSTEATNGDAHSIVGFFVGDDATDFNDWYFIEPQTDSVVNPGDFSMDENSYVHLKRDVYYYNIALQKFKFGTLSPIKFDLYNNGQDSITFQHPDLVPTRKIIPLHLSGDLPNDTTLNYQVGISDSVDFPIANMTPSAVPKYNSVSTQIMNEGFEQVNFDIANNVVLTRPPYNWIRDTLGTYNVAVRDLEKPGFVDLPQKQVVNYGDVFPSIDSASTTDNSALPVDVVYSDSSTQDPDNTKCEHYNYDIFRNYTATDVAGNKSDTTANVLGVSKPNSLVYDFVPNDTTVDKNADLHPDNLGWATGSDTLGPLPTSMDYDDYLVSSTTSKDVWERGFKFTNNCGQEKDTSYTITVDKTNSIEENKENAFSVYPNPTNGIINLKGKVQNGNYKNVYWEIYNLQGKLVDNGKEEVYDKFNKEIDISNLKKGAYILDLTIDGKTKSYHKVIKN